jgi:outer membrane receptor protein involved in Fe transport
MNYKINTVTSALILALSSTSSWADTDNSEIERIEIKGEILPTSQNDAANSVDIIDPELIKKTGAVHIQDVLQSVGNINYASGSSRARFFQVRGIGERSQFVDPVNPSVGVAIDGIDYTDMAHAATLFDIEQVEIFKGPQGTNIGANALAGFINLTSTAPGTKNDSKLSASLGNYGYTQLAFANGGKVSSKLDYRVSINKTDGNGYIDNTYLNKDDTNGFDELSIRAKFDARISKYWQSQWIFHQFDINNGYDAFSLDLDRTTLSDEPGFDNNETQAIGIDNQYTKFEDFDVRVFASNTQSDLAYGYDEDWAYGSYNEDWTFSGIHEDGYASTDHYFRDRMANQLDVSLSGKNKNWVVGLYTQQKSTDLTRQYTWLSGDFTSEYDVTNIALYGEGRYTLTSDIEVSAGLRVENYDGDYLDSNAVDTNTQETMWGGHISASKTYSDTSMAYFRVSRGFKAGGINGEALAKLQDDSLARFHGELIQNQSFEAESLLNYELGGKYLSKDSNLSAQFTLFYSSRDNMQIKQWLTDNQDVPVFVGYLSNAPTGANYGAETQVSYNVNASFDVFASFAALKTEVQNFDRIEVNAESGNEEQVKIDGRAQAHAPEYQYQVGANWAFSNNWLLNLTVQGKDAYFYSYSHDEMSEAVTLVNASIVYSDTWGDITFWGRNLSDEEYGVRGFYFGNDPRDGYTAKNYEQFGEPRVFGVTFNYLF